MPYDASPECRQSARIALGAALIVALAGAHAAASDPAVAAPRPAPCGRQSKRLPATIHLPRELGREVELMLLRSRTFRAQCRRLAGAPWLVVLIRVDPAIGGRSYRARTEIGRTPAGAMVARMYLGVHEPAEWIAHEFEHLLEQLDGLDLPALAASGRGVWMSSDRMYESERAIRAGRAVLGELRRPPPIGETDMHVE